MLTALTNLRLMNILIYVKIKDRCVLDPLVVMKESETTMAKFRVTQKRADRGVLNRSLQNKYNDLARTSRLVKQLKEMEPERYLKILKDRLEKTQHIS